MTPTGCAVGAPAGLFSGALPYITRDDVHTEWDGVRQFAEDFLAAHLLAGSAARG